MSSNVLNDHNNLSFAIIFRQKLLLSFIPIFANITVFINKKLCKNMRQFKVLLLLIAISCSMFAQDRLSLFIGRANKYASVELSDYRKRLCIEYNTPNNLLDDYYRQCGRDWGM